MSESGKETAQDREKLKEKPLRDLGNYTINLKVSKAKSGKVVEAYVVREMPKGDAHKTVANYDVATSLAVQLQEKESDSNPPKEYEKTYLMSIGDINIYRTVGRTKRGLAWRYVGEDAGGEPLFEGDHFWEVSVHAVNEEVARVNRAKREGVI